MAKFKITANINGRPDVVKGIDSYSSDNKIIEDAPFVDIGDVVNDTQLTSVKSVRDYFEENNHRLRKVINIVVASSAPPTEVDGDRYILQTGTTPHADWDGALAGQVVEFNGAGGAWDAQTPVEGQIAYVDAQNLDGLYVDDGTAVWELRPPSAENTDDLLNTSSVTGTSCTDALNNLLLSTNKVTVPTTPTSTGIEGQWAYGANYLYKCVDTDVWVRTAVESSWS